MLDDSKLLTLPNGERLSVPPNVRIMFEVQDLKYATLATVSRCGMVWFSEDVVTPEMKIEHYLCKLRSVPLEESEDEMRHRFSNIQGSSSDAEDKALSPIMQVQRDVADILAPHLTSDGLVLKCLQYAADLDHVMDFTKMRALNSLFSMLNQGARNIITYNQQHPDFPMTVCYFFVVL